MAYAAPFAAYIALMALQSAWPMPDAVDLAVRVLVVGAAIVADDDHFRACEVFGRTGDGARE